MRSPVRSRPIAVRHRLRIGAAVCLAGGAIILAGCATSTTGKYGPPVVAPPRTPPGPAAPPPATPPRTTARRPPSPRTTLNELLVRVRVRDNLGERVEALPVDDYVAGTVRAELAPATLRDAALGKVLEIQAIVSRTYTITHLDRHQAEGFDLCDSTHCQLYRPAPPPSAGQDGDSATNAALRTRGQVITYEGRAIQAVFHADCGGHTAAAELVWSGPAVPYLRPVPDWFCSRAADSRWEFDVDEVRLRGALNAETRTAVGSRLDRIDIVGRDPAGRAAQVTLVGTQSPQLRAEEFRAVLLRHFGPRSLRSTWFSVVRRQGTFHFTGLGNGHGVGLCQAGAALRAKAGQSPVEVLSHYFPGTRVESVTTLDSVLGPAATVRQIQ